jgi:SAM-dependent methyltransferase
MTADEKARWDERYASGEYRPRTEPSPLIEKAIAYIEPGRALVLACGAGRNAIHLAAAGFWVDAVDVSSVAIDLAEQASERRGLDVRWHVADVSEFDFDQGAYDLITMIRYTNRSVWPRLVPALSDTGWLLLDQHLKTRHDVVGPSNEFRLESGELLAAFPGLRVIEFFEEYKRSENHDRMTATTGLLACKGDPGW